MGRCGGRKGGLFLVGLDSPKQERQGKPPDARLVRRGFTSPPSFILPLRKDLLSLGQVTNFSEILFPSLK